MGARSAFIEVPEGAVNDARWTQLVTDLTPGHSYKVCGKMRGSVGPNAPGGSLFYDLTSDDTVSWWKQTGDFLEWPDQPHCDTFVAVRDYLKVGCRIGFYSATTYGTIWCDEMSLREVTGLDGG